MIKDDGDVDENTWWAWLKFSRMMAMYMLMTIMKLMMMKDTKKMMETKGKPQLPFGNSLYSGSQSGGWRGKVSLKVIRLGLGSVWSGNLCQQQFCKPLTLKFGYFCLTVSCLIIQKYSGFGVFDLNFVCTWDMSGSSTSFQPAEVTSLKYCSMFNTNRMMQQNRGNQITIYHLLHLKRTCIDRPKVSKLTKSLSAPWCLTWPKMVIPMMA